MSFLSKVARRMSSKTLNAGVCACHSRPRMRRRASGAYCRYAVVRERVCRRHCGAYIARHIAGRGSTQASSRNDWRLCTAFARRSRPRRATATDPRTTCWTRWRRRRRRCARRWRRSCGTACVCVRAVCVCVSLGGSNAARAQAVQCGGVDATSQAWLGRSDRVLLRCLPRAQRLKSSAGDDADAAWRIATTLAKINSLAFGATIMSIQMLRRVRTELGLVRWAARARFRCHTVAPPVRRLTSNPRPPPCPMVW